MHSAKITIAYMRLNLNNADNCVLKINHAYNGVCKVTC